MIVEYPKILLISFSLYISIIRRGGVIRSGDLFGSGIDQSEILEIGIDEAEGGLGSKYWSFHA